MKTRTMELLLLLFPGYYLMNRQERQRSEGRREQDERRRPSLRDSDEIDRRPAGQGDGKVSRRPYRKTS